MYYKRIKGVGGATQIAEITPGYFTYIYFMDPAYAGQSEKKWENFNSTTGDISHSPSIEFSQSGDDYSNTEHLGHIITTDCKNGFIKNSFTFNDLLEVGKDLKLGGNIFSTKGYGTIEITPTGFTFDKAVHIDNELSTNGKLIVNDNLTVTGTAEIRNATEIKSTLTVTGSGSYIQAPYFNATSDRRAKTNIEQASFNALQAVKNLSIYTFNYKDTNSPSLGVIAQDAAQIDFGTDFNLVNNLEASGENGDYMTIKESKMIYVLWKAVQEQQEEIERLKKIINEVKNND